MQALDAYGVEPSAAPAALWVICGGGRRNRFLMELLAWHLDAPVVVAMAL